MHDKESVLTNLDGFTRNRHDLSNAEGYTKEEVYLTNLRQIDVQRVDICPAQVHGDKIGPVWCNSFKAGASSPRLKRFAEFQHLFYPASTHLQTKY